MSGADIDPVTVEIIQNKLNSFIREMRGAIIRTAFGPIIWESHDFSCGLLAPDGELVALSDDNPVHIVPTIYSVPAVQERFGDAIAPGDIFLLNDPYRLGTHLNDIAHMCPFLVDNRLTFWIVVRVHYPDVGGMAAGSITPDSTEIYQEGMFIPPVKVYDAGEVNEGFLDLFFANVRVADERRGDFMAVIGALWTAQKRLQEIVGSFGPEKIVRAHQISRDRAQRRMEEAIGRLPEGTYGYELNLDSNGVEPGWVPLRVDVVVKHDPVPKLTVDFRDNGPGVPGPMNGAPATAACAAVTAIKAFLDPTSQINGGTFRPIEIVTEPDTIFESRSPAAMCGSLDLGYRVIGLVMGALGSIRPEDAIGDYVGPSHQYLAFWDPERERHYVFYEMPIGGTGAIADHDGGDAVAGFERGDFPRISSVEVWEHQVPFIAEETTLLADSGGAGKFRGGLGMRRGWRMLADSGTVTDLSEPSFVPAYGVLGGQSGTPSTCRVRRGKKSLWPGGETGTGKATRFPLRKGDVVQYEKWGAGGYGDPVERDPRRVVEDVHAGYVSRDAARDVYGVVVDGGVVDVPATKKRRRQLSSQRVFVEVQEQGTDSTVSGYRAWEISPETASRLRVEDGHVLECISDGRAPLRGVARINAQLPTSQLPTGPVGRKILGRRQGEKVRLRAVANVLYPTV